MSDNTNYELIEMIITKSNEHMDTQLAVYDATEIY